MKFGLLRCLIFAFACIIGTCGVSVWADEVICDRGQYVDGDTCKRCPTNDSIGVGELYQFKSAGTGIESCAVKLNLDKSKCGEGTNVVYRYIEKDSDDNDINDYVLDVDNYTVIPDDGFVRLYESTYPNDNGEYEVPFYLVGGQIYYGYGEAQVYETALDHCGSKCQLGQYINENNMCESCPLAGTNANDAINNNSSYFKFVKYGNGKGKTSCAIEENTFFNRGFCATTSYVVYVYNMLRDNYVRTKADVYPTSKSVVNSEFPPDDDMGVADSDHSRFCMRCPGSVSVVYQEGNPVVTVTEKPFSVNGKCSACEEPGFYLYVQGIEAACQACPAGYYCPGKTNDETTSQKSIMCPGNTYSEEGATECTPCPQGYSTASGGPAEEGYDGLCLDREDDEGVGCVSQNACKLAKMSLSVQRSGSNSWVKFLLGDNIKIESLNRSVVQENR